MGRRRLLIVAAVLGACGAAGWLAVPRRYTVVGVSMGPALLPGDVVATGAFPAGDRQRMPRRFECWVLTAADGLALKRVVGLPGEQVSIEAGDLVIDGAVAAKGPRLLAEMGSAVGDQAPGAGAPGAAGWTWSRDSAEILDETPGDADATRRLSAVGDAGLAALVDVRGASAAAPVAIRVLVGDTVVPRSLTEPGRHAVVAGRLDGRLVAASWTVPGGAGATGPRSCLPAGAPDGWDVADPWPGRAGDRAPALGIDTGGAALVAVGRWRDVAYRPGADGRSSWRLGRDEVFVLGDHPPASVDSRRWGPVAVAALRHRVAVRPSVGFPGRAAGERPP